MGQLDNNLIIKTYHVKHRKCFEEELSYAKEVADYAVAHKHNRSMLSTKNVKHIPLKSAIKNQILRKYGKSDTIKEASRVNLVVPNQKSTIKSKNGDRIYDGIIFENGIVTIKCMKLSFRWNPGCRFERINQIEISRNKYMICASFKKECSYTDEEGILGIDLNCGIGRHVVNAANLNTGETINLGKNGPYIRKRYKSLRKRSKCIGQKESRIMKDLDHKMSRRIVNYASQHKLRIVMEDLKGIRKTKTRGNSSREVNRIVNSWSFYRLQAFVEYKSEEVGVSFEKINPQYTSQECSFCGIIGKRDHDIFECKNKLCRCYKTKINSDINAAFNIGRRSTQDGGCTQEKKSIRRYL